MVSSFRLIQGGNDEWTIQQSCGFVNESTAFETDLASAFGAKIRQRTIQPNSRHQTNAVLAQVVTGIAAGRCLETQLTIHAPMGKLYESITAELRDWLAEQKVFFVATSPLAQDGHVNCSPKGGDTFRVLGDKQVAYLDLTGSGIETTAHLQENGRIVIMFCAFSGPPSIVRLHGKGEVVYPNDSDFPNLQRCFPAHPGVRAIIRVTVTRISDSCGHGVPLMDFVARRDLIEKWSAAKGPQGLAEYRAAKNRASVDGIGGYKT